jgi:hypothetical protein
MNRIVFILSLLFVVFSNLHNGVSAIDIDLSHRSKRIGVLASTVKRLASSDIQATGGSAESRLAPSDIQATDGSAKTKSKKKSTGSQKSKKSSSTRIKSSQTKKKSSQTTKKFGQIRKKIGQIRKKSSRPTVRSREFSVVEIEREGIKEYRKQKGLTFDHPSYLETLNLIPGLSPEIACMTKNTRRFNKQITFNDNKDLQSLFSKEFEPLVLFMGQVLKILKGYEPKKADCFSDSYIDGFVKDVETSAPVKFGAISECVRNHARNNQTINGLYRALCDEDSVTIKAVLRLTSLLIRVAESAKSISGLHIHHKVENKANENISKEKFEQSLKELKDIIYGKDMEKVLRRGTTRPEEEAFDQIHFNELGEWKKPETNDKAKETMRSNMQTLYKFVSKLGTITKNMESMENTLEITLMDPCSNHVLDTDIYRSRHVSSLIKQEAALCIKALDENGLKHTIDRMYMGNNMESMLQDIKDEESAMKKAAVKNQESKDQDVNVMIMETWQGIDSAAVLSDSVDKITGGILAEKMKESQLSMQHLGRNIRSIMMSFLKEKDTIPPMDDCPFGTYISNEYEKHFQNVTKLSLLMAMHFVDTKTLVTTNMEGHPACRMIGRWDNVFSTLYTLKKILLNTHYFLSDQIIEKYSSESFDLEKSRKKYCQCSAGHEIHAFPRSSEESCQQLADDAEDKIKKRKEVGKASMEWMQNSNHFLTTQYKKIDDWVSRGLLKASRKLRFLKNKKKVGSKKKVKPGRRRRLLENAKKKECKNYLLRLKEGTENEIPGRKDHIPNTIDLKNKNMDVKLEPIIYTVRDHSSGMTTFKGKDISEHFTGFAVMARIDNGKLTYQFTCGEGNCKTADGKVNMFNTRKECGGHVIEMTYDLKLKNGDDPSVSFPSTSLTFSSSQMSSIGWYSITPSTGSRRRLLSTTKGSKTRGNFC